MQKIQGGGRQAVFSEEWCELEIGRNGNVRRSEWRTGTAPFDRFPPVRVRLTRDELERLRRFLNAMAGL